MTGPPNNRRCSSTAASGLRALTGKGRNSSRSHRARDGHRFESPPLLQEVGANNPEFLAPTIPRLFSALARKLLVCAVHSAGTAGLGRRTRK